MAGLAWSSQLQRQEDAFDAAMSQAQRLIYNDKVPLALRDRLWKTVQEMESLHLDVLHYTRANLFDTFVEFILDRWGLVPVRRTGRI